MPDVVAPAAPVAPVTPVAPAAPAPKPKAEKVERVEPQVTVDTHDQDIGSAIDDIVKSSVAEAVKSETEAELPARDASGKFLPKDGQQPAQQKPLPVQPPELKQGTIETAVEEAVAMGDDTFELPEGFVAPAKADRQLKTQFKLLDKDGTELEVPEVMIAFKANGKDRSATLDHVVKMAEWGVYNQEREQQWETKLRQADQTQQNYQQLVSYARQLEAEKDALLSDDSAYLRAKARHDALNTPQALAERARMETQQAREQLQVTQIHAQGAQFFNAELVPAINTITKSLPLVSDEEIGAKMLLITERFKVQTSYGGVIPPQQYDAIRQALLTDVVPWAQQLNDAREQDRSAALKESTTKTKQAEQSARTAQIDAQKAKSLVGRVTRPGARGGSQSTSTREQPKPAPIRTVDDAEKAALAATLEAMRHAS